MKILYFKASEFGDCYIGEKNNKIDLTNIISLTKDYISIRSIRNFRGFFREAEISDKYFKELEQAADSRDRNRGVNLINKVHSSTPSIEEGTYSEFGDWYLEEKRRTKAREIYENAKPILE